MLSCVDDDLLQSQSARRPMHRGKFREVRSGTDDVQEFHGLLVGKGDEYRQVNADE